MKTIQTSLLVLFFAVIRLSLFAQAPVKQYSGGNNGSVLAPVHALGTDLSNYSTLKLKTPSTQKDYVYQNFVFIPASGNEARVVFVIQTNESLEASNEAAISLKFYTGMNDQVSADTLRTEEVQITKTNEALGLYEFSFMVAKNFDTAGILLHGGGILRMAKIYKVYMAINNTPTIPFKFVSAKV